MKGTLKTTIERAEGVVAYLSSVGLRQDEICNMCSVSVVLLGMNPETRLAPIVSYLERRGVPEGCIPDLLLAHPHWRERVDPARVGGFGASQGGETLMLMGGAALTRVGRPPGS
jgi:hypothetical protein